jgi:hypothetical protein
MPAELEADLAALFAQVNASPAAAAALAQAIDDQITRRLEAATLSGTINLSAISPTLKSFTDTEVATFTAEISNGGLA